VSRNIKIQKILSSNHKPVQIGLALFGCLIGFFLILASVQSIINFKYLFADPKQGIGSQYMVINKKVSMLNTLKVSNSTFSKGELKKIASHPAVEKISTFTRGKFKSQIVFDLVKGPNPTRLISEFFLESVGDDFIDIELDKWKWDSSSKEIPVILPSDFINLYNFTFAPSQELIQVSKNTIKGLNFTITLRGNNQLGDYKGNIIGFSDRISTILVPNSFVNYANNRFGDPEKIKDTSAYRIIAAVKPNELSNFQKFLKENNYETNEEILRNGKYLGLMYLFISIIFIIGLIITINAFTGFILYFHLLIYRSRNEIDSLLRLGYPHIKLVKNYLYRIALMILPLVVISLGLLFYAQRSIAKLLLEYKFIVPKGIDPYSIITILCVTTILLFIFFIQIKTEIYKIALPEKRKD
jgi:hypothetical protein